MLERFHELDETDAEGVSPTPQFDYIDASNPDLALADEGLVLTNSAGQLVLTHADPSPGCFELLEKGGVLARVKRFGHRLPMWASR